MLKKSRVKSTTKANADIHHGNIKRNKTTSKPLLILNKNFCGQITEIKSVWLVISEAGNAVCGV